MSFMEKKKTKIRNIQEINGVLSLSLSTRSWHPQGRTMTVYSIYIYACVSVLICKTQDLRSLFIFFLYEWRFFADITCSNKPSSRRKNACINGIYIYSICLMVCVSVFRMFCVRVFEILL